MTKEDIVFKKERSVCGKTVLVLVIRAAVLVLGYEVFSDYSGARSVNDYG